MSRHAVPLETVVEVLRAEGLLPDATAGDATALVRRLRALQPWYIRAMVGVGAWLASLLVIGFVASFGLALGGSAVIGLVLMTVAVWARRMPALADNDFAGQSTLAISLAGQALFAWGLADALSGDAELGCAIVLIVSSVMFFLYPDRVHRLLMVLFAASAATLLIYIYELNGLIPVVGPAFAAALVLLQRRRGALYAGGKGQLVWPLENGLMLSAFGCLLLSTIYVLPELTDDVSFYPRPWISTVLLGGLFLQVGGMLRPALLEQGTAAWPVALVLMLAIVAASWQAPGVLLALVVVILGAARGHTSFVGAGIAFLVVFLGAYFYGIEVTMLTKSLTLAAAGLVILLARCLLLGLPGGRRA
jgi:hypothetical protein